MKFTLLVGKSNTITVPLWQELLVDVKAVFRRFSGGDRFLAALEELATHAAQSVPDPTPPGEDPGVREEH